MNITKYFSFTLSFLTLIFFGTVALYSQSHFNYPEGQNATVFPIKNNESKELILLLFQFESHFDLAFFSGEMQMDRIISSRELPQNLRGKEIQSIINQPRHLFVFISDPEGKNNHKTQLLRINKLDGSYEVIAIPKEPIEMTEMFSMLKLFLLCAFEDEYSFYKIWIHPSSSSFHILAYDIRKSKELVFKSLRNPLVGDSEMDHHPDRIAMNLGKGMGLSPNIPIIRNSNSSFRINTVKEQKIYLFEDNLYISVEDQKAGFTDLHIINTNTWKIEGKSYIADPVGSIYFSDDIKNGINSIIHEGYLYQLIYNSAGLHLRKIEIDTDRILKQTTWPDEESFNKDFSYRSRKGLGEDSFESTKSVNLWEHFKHSLTLNIRSEGDREKIIIGSHRFNKDIEGEKPVSSQHTTPENKAKLGTLSFIKSDSGHNFGSAFQPFSSINLLIDAAYYFSGVEIYEAESIFDSETLTLETIPKRDKSFNNTINSWAKILDQVKEEIRNNHTEMALFEWNSKIYIGYWRENNYYINEISN